MSYSVPYSFSPNTTAQSAQVNADFNALVNAANALAAQIAALPSGSGLPIFPGGRLTLTSNTPIMKTDVNGSGAIYYAPYIGATAPIYNGSTWTQNAFSQLTLTLNSAQHLSGSVFDVFLFLNSGNVTIAAGPAWTNTGARSAATALTLLNGIWVNSNSFSSTLYNGVTTYSASANQATYIGSFYATANGQTTMNLAPTINESGMNGFVGLFNAYNRVRMTSIGGESTSQFFPNTENTWEPLHASDGNGGLHNRITYLDGLGQVEAIAYLMTFVRANGVQTSCGIVFNSTSATPTLAATFINTSTTPGASITCIARGAPTLGLSYAQMMEYGDTSNSVFYGAGGGNVYTAYSLELFN